MLDTVRGLTSNDVVAGQLAEKITDMDLNGTLYLGYPVLATADESITVDALLVSREHGLVAFILGDSTPREDDSKRWQEMREQQDAFYFALKSMLSRHKNLRLGRDLALEINTVTVLPVAAVPPEEIELFVCDLNHVREIVEGFSELDEKILRPLQAALQRVTTIKPAKKRANVKKRSSRGAVLKEVEREIANLDQWQKGAAIESPEGQQRIRGLAGSGKTVVLALKAAYLQAQHPEWTICVTFQTRSLYQQLTDLIRRFTYEHQNDEPNWENLRVLHAWGGFEREGVYTQMAARTKVEIRDFLYAKNLYGMTEAFNGVCKELLTSLQKEEADPIYDAVLIDEAQDLPPSFFQLVYHFSRPPHRIVWAYDELQRLSETSMPRTEELFGFDKNGRRRVELGDVAGRPRQDIVLPVCYRNTPWALTLAHALGLGIYRKEGLVQHFDDPSLWEDIGYEVVDGDLAPGKNVKLKRRANSYPKYFENRLEPDDAVVAQVFPDPQNQLEWVAESIKRNLTEDELEPDDILVILPDPYTAKKQGALIADALARKGVPAHLAGVTSSRDEIFRKDSVAIAHIHRSKGNEAPMVYILDSQRCVAGHELITLRNTLFTAITRCRAWVRICGWGSRMEALNEEIKSVRKRNYQLEFKVPTQSDLNKMRMIHRERTAGEKARIEKAERGLKEFLDAWKRGDLVFENLPPDMRTALANLLREEEYEDGESK